MPKKEEELNQLKNDPLAYWKHKLPGMGGVLHSPNLGLYSYGHNNPVTLKDPDGNFVIAPVLPILGKLLLDAAGTALVILVGKEAYDNISESRGQSVPGSGAQGELKREQDKLDVINGKLNEGGLTKEERGDLLKEQTKTKQRIKTLEKVNNQRRRSGGPEKNKGGNKGSIFPFFNDNQRPQLPGEPEPMG